jgi:hypothetical protein
MTDFTESPEAARPLTPRERKRAITSWEAERKGEREAGLAVLAARRKAEERARVQQHVLELWPMWLGLVAGMFGPAIAFVARTFGSWCMTLVFPFVVLAQRPELQVGPITHVLPDLMLYLQFPIEGWLAYFVLRHRVKPLGVLLQVMLFHFLGLAELWMLTGTAFDFLRR